MNRHKGTLKILSKRTFIPTTPLALKEDCSMNEKTQKILIRYHLDAGVGGTAATVHNTQFVIRSPGYRFLGRILQLVSEEIGRFEERHKETIAKIGGVYDRTSQTVSEAVLVERMGYDVVFLSPGGLGHLTEEELLERTKVVAEIMPVIGFYLQAAMGGRRFTYGYWENTCRIPNVVAIKCTSFNRYSTVDVMHTVTSSGRGEKTALYTGNDNSLLVGFLTPYRLTMDGAERNIDFRGGLLGHWCIWTKKVIGLSEKVKRIQGQDCIPADLSMQATELTGISETFFDAAHEFGGYTPGLHEILRRQGIFRNTLCLDPKEAVPQERIEGISRIYRMYPQQNDDIFIADNLDRWNLDV